MKTAIDSWLHEDTENVRLLEQEALILEVGEEVWDAFEKEGISKADLAERLRVSKSHVTQLLNGSRNVTLRTLADIGVALNKRVQIKFRPLNWERGWIPVVEERVQAESPAFHPFDPLYAEDAANDGWVKLGKVA